LDNIEAFFTTGVPLTPVNRVSAGSVWRAGWRQAEEPVSQSWSSFGPSHSTATKCGKWTFWASTRKAHFLVQKTKNTRNLCWSGPGWSLGSWVVLHVENRSAFRLSIFLFRVRQRLRRSSDRWLPICATRPKFVIFELRHLAIWVTATRPHCH
jgi:hypothetical protein